MRCSFCRPFQKVCRLLDCHLLGVRTSLDLYSIDDPTEFAAKLKSKEVVSFLFLGPKKNFVCPQLSCPQLS